MHRKISLKAATRVLPDCYGPVFGVFGDTKFYVIVLLQLFRVAIGQRRKMEKYLAAALTAGNKSKIAFQRPYLQQDKPSEKAICKDKEEFSHHLTASLQVEVCPGSPIKCFRCS